MLCCLTAVLGDWLCVRVGVCARVLLAGEQENKNEASRCLQQKKENNDLLTKLTFGWHNDTAYGLPFRGIFNTN